MNIPSSVTQQSSAPTNHLNVRATGQFRPVTTTAFLDRLSCSPNSRHAMVCDSTTPRPRPTSAQRIDDCADYVYPNVSVEHHLAGLSSLSLIDGADNAATVRSTYWNNCYKQDMSCRQSDSSPDGHALTATAYQSAAFNMFHAQQPQPQQQQQQHQELQQNLLTRLSPRLSHLDNYLLLQHIEQLAKSSLSLDQGYHTLVPSSGCGGGGDCVGTNDAVNGAVGMSPAPSTRLNGDPPPPIPAATISASISKKKKKKKHHQEQPQQAQQQQLAESQAQVMQVITQNPFDLLNDRLIGHIFQQLGSHELSICARVCRRWDAVVWRTPGTSPNLWRSLTLTGQGLSGDRAIRAMLRQLCGQGRTGACPAVEKVQVRDGATLTDRGVTLLARRCPALNHMQVHGAAALTNSALLELVTRCTNLQHLDVTGCVQISCIGANFGPPDILRRLQLQYLDLTDCSALQDNGLRIIVRNCPQLAYLYLRRCALITDAGFKYIPSFCSGLRELSVSDCLNITDFGLYELAKLGATLRYLSVAKCDQVSDAGLKVISKRCYKLRYVNVRGCEAVSDDAITVLARSCTRLRALDIGKCDVSDAGLRALAESCPNLKKLSLRSCDLVTDRGVQCVSYYCRGLQQLNIQDCQISLDGYRAVKKYCKRCVIEHTNPGFF